MEMIIDVVIQVMSKSNLTLWFSEGADWRQLPDTDVLPDDNMIVGWTDHPTVFSVASTTPEPATVAVDNPTLNVQRQGSGSSSCFIATAAYGSPLAPQVKVLRAFRDTYLLTNKPGSWLVALYYKLSPPLADVIRGHDDLRAIVRMGLTPQVWGTGWMLQAEGLQRLMWGVSVFLILSTGVVWRWRRKMT